MRSLLVAVLLLAACGKGDKPPAPTSGAPNAKPETGPGGPAVDNGDEAQKTPAQEASILFANVCATCHGADGAGNGVAAESLPTKPRNYKDAAWQASVKDEEIAKIIVEGGQAVGKSSLMPGQAQLKDKPEVVAELVKMIRGFGKP